MMQTSNAACQPQSFIEAGIFEIFGNGVRVPVDTKSSLSSPLVVYKEQFIRDYGKAETNGLFIRAGRAAFYYWLSQYAADLGWKDAEFRLIPPPVRTRKALSEFIAWLKQENLLDAELNSSCDYWQIIRPGPTQPDSGLDCSYLLGMLQELVSWAGGGKFYPAFEEQCQAAGAKECVFKINCLPAN